MGQYMVVAIGIALIILAILFFKEKDDTRNREHALEELLEVQSEKLQHAQEESEKLLNATIDEGLKKASDSLESAVLDVNRRINENEKDLENKEGRLQGLIEEKNASVEEKIEIISKILTDINKENAELRKKLEFFAEIGEDSKNINESDDHEAREQLIKQALEELSTKDKRANTSIPDFTPTTIGQPSDNGIQVKPPERGGDILDEEQRVAFKIMETTNENLFITGKAGTGKSFLLEMFVRGTSKRTITVAPTGIAALNVGGATIHSTFGYHNLEELSLDSISIDSIRLKDDKKRVLKNIDTLIIDEISMVRVDTFDKIDKILRVLNESAKPFGGIQVIVFGDLFQLPPIAKRQEEKYLTDYYGGIFFFNSNAFSNGNFGFIELTTNHRQKEDKEFFSILNRMREGDTTSSDIDLLNTRFVDNRDSLRRVMTLFPKKADAERLNKEELSRIEAKEYVYNARIIFDAYNNKTINLDANFPISSELHLKRGALVMMVANDPNKRWVNGTIGIIHSLTDDGIKVTIDGTTHEVDKMTFTQREAVYERGKISYKDVLSVEQYPLVLAYAITIHKSQGMTYKQIACDISQCFAPGQAYVALSRCSSMQGLYLMSLIREAMIHSNLTVVDFYRKQSTRETIERFS